MDTEHIESQIKRIDEKVDRLYTSWFGNGTPGVKTEVELLKTSVGIIAEEKKWLTRLVVGTIIPVLILGSIAITKIAWSGQYKVQESKQVVPKVSHGNEDNK